MRSITLFLILSVQLLMPSPLLSQVRVNSEKELVVMALEHFKNNKYIDSILLWKTLIFKDPKKSLYYFNLASVYYKLDQYEKAIKQFTKVIELNGNLTYAAKLYIGMSFMFMGNKYDSKKIFYELVNDDLVQSEIKKTAKDSLTKIHGNKKIETQKNVPIEYILALKFFKRQQYQKAMLNFEISAEGVDTPEFHLIRGITYFKLDKNKLAMKSLKLVLNKSTNLQINKNAKILIELIQKKKTLEKKSPTNFVFEYDSSLNYTENPLSLNEIDSSTKRSRFKNQLDLGYRFKPSSKLGIVPQYSGKYEFEINERKESFVDHRIVSTVSSNSLKHFISVSPKAIKQYSNGKGYLEKYGTGLNYQYRVSKNHSIGVSTQYLNNSAINDTNNFLNGYTVYNRIFLNYRTHKYNLRLSLLSSDEKYNDSESFVLSNRGSGASLSLNFYPTSKTTVNSSLNFLEQKYNTNPNIESFQVTKNLSFVFGFNILYTDELSFYFNIQSNFIDNKIEDENIANNILSEDKIFLFEDSAIFGLNWRFQ